jgi:hypothetical protein
LSKIKDLNKKFDSLQPNSITTGSLNNIYQKPSIDRRNSIMPMERRSSIFQGERRGSIMPNPYSNIPKPLQNRRMSTVNSNEFRLLQHSDSRTSALEDRIEALENKIDELIKTLTNKKQNFEN